MKILVVRDANPGHYNQSEGIVDALRQFADVSVSRISIPERIPALNWLTRHLLNWNLDEWALSFCRLTPGDLPDEIDLVVSAGGSTLPVNIALARHFDSQNIFSGSIRKFHTDDFTAILHIDAKRKDWPKHIIGLKPAPLSDVVVKPLSIPQKSGTLLLGGPIEGCSLRDGDIEAILSSIASSGFSWSVLDSRRTPAAWSSAARDLANIDRAITYRSYKNSAKNELTNTLAQSDAVLVTGDSTSMISESITLQRPTLSLEPKGGSTTRDKSYLNMLESEKWLARHYAPFGDWESLNKEISQCRPKQKSPVFELASRLKTALLEKGQSLGSVSM